MSREAAVLARLADLDEITPGFGDPTGFGRFEFGSYGRVSTAWNLRGGQGRQLAVVRHAPRLQQGPYAEIDLRYHKDFPGAKGPVRVRSVLTLALNEQLFHFDGDWRAGLAVRNLFLEAADLGGAVDLWVGSRMLRGDDVYLLDTWPLDDLNTVGGGAFVHRGRLRLGLHVGANRLPSQFQEQSIEVPLDDAIGSETVLYLDRQRTLVSGQGELRLSPEGARVGAKLKVHVEGHMIPAGRLREDPDTVTELPADTGFLAGLQFGLWDREGRGFANIFLRVATGLAAYGPLSVPYGLDRQKRTVAAREFQAALSTHLDFDHVGLLTAAYARFFRDADRNDYDRDDGWEGAVAIRPTIFVNRFYHQAFEFSVQARAPRGLEPESYRLTIPAVVAISAIPALSFDKGSLARPQFRLVYTLSVMNEGARLDLPRDDPRRDGCDPRGACPATTQHYLGLQAEWWFNSSYR